eukprot:PhF_6_TR6744/c0_g1_i1/m.9747
MKNCLSRRRVHKVVSIRKSTCIKAATKYVMKVLSRRRPSRVVVQAMGIAMQKAVRVASKVRRKKGKRGVSLRISMGTVGMEDRGILRRGNACTTSYLKILLRCKRKTLLK